MRYTAFSTFVFLSAFSIGVLIYIFYSFGEQASIFLLVPIAVGLLALAFYLGRLAYVLLLSPLELETAVVREAPNGNCELYLNRRFLLIPYYHQVFRASTQPEDLLVNPEKLFRTRDQIPMKISLVLTMSVDGESIACVRRAAARENKGHQLKVMALPKIEAFLFKVIREHDHSELIASVDKFRDNFLQQVAADFREEWGRKILSADIQEFSDRNGIEVLITARNTAEKETKLEMEKRAFEDENKQDILEHALRETNRELEKEIDKKKMAHKRREYEIQSEETIDAKETQLAVQKLHQENKKLEIKGELDETNRKNQFNEQEFLRHASVAEAEKAVEVGKRVSQVDQLANEAALVQAERLCDLRERELRQNTANPDGDLTHLRALEMQKTLRTISSEQSKILAAALAKTKTYIVSDGQGSNHISDALTKAIALNARLLEGLELIEESELLSIFTGALRSSSKHEKEKPASRQKEMDVGAEDLL